MTDDALFPIWLSLRIALVTLVLVAPIGIALAWLQASRSYRLRSLVDALVLLPMVLPPSVIGFFLVWIFGRRGAVGQILEGIGVRIIFTPAAAVMASTVVALPVLVKAAQPAMEAVPQELISVGRSLGLAPGELFVRVVLRGAWRGVATGLVLAFVRALGEFGATLMFAGNIPGRTNTMPIEIFSAYQAGDDARALMYVTVLTVASSLTVLAAARVAPARAARG
jgi:molybdate transport system permease protein